MSKKPKDLRTGNARPESKEAIRILMPKTAIPLIIPAVDPQKAPPILGGTSVLSTNGEAKKPTKLSACRKAGVFFSLRNIESFLIAHIAYTNNDKGE